MRSRLWNLLQGHLNLALKCGSVLFLFLISVLVVACGASNTTQAPGTPVVTVTINLNQTFSSPTPALAAYSCGAWATQTSPPYSVGGTVQVYAKYVQNVNGNPQGMANASAHAIVHWPDGSSTPLNEQTTADGLAVFQVPLEASSLNKVTLVEVDFTSADGQHTCNVQNDQEAYFTALNVTPVVTPSPSPAATPSATPPWWLQTPTATAVNPNPSITPTTRHGGK